MRAPFQAGRLSSARSSTATRASGGSSAVRASCRAAQVFVLYPHQTRYVVPAAGRPRAARRRAARARRAAANLETAINGLWDARPHVGDRIVGHRRRHGRLPRGVAGRPHPGLRRGARRHQPAARSHRARASASASPRPDTHPAKAPTSSFTRAARPPGSSWRSELRGSRRTVVEMSWYGDQPVPLPLGEAFHARRLTLKSSQVGQRRPARSARDGTRAGGCSWRSRSPTTRARRADHGRERVRRLAGHDGASWPPAPATRCAIGSGMTTEELAPGLSQLCAPADAGAASKFAWLAAAR